MVCTLFKWWCRHLHCLCSFISLDTALLSQSTRNKFAQKRQLLLKTVSGYAEPRFAPPSLYFPQHSNLVNPLCAHTCGSLPPHFGIPISNSPAWHHSMRLSCLTVCFINTGTGQPCLCLSSVDVLWSVYHSQLVERTCFALHAETFWQLWVRQDQARVHWWLH